MKACTIIIPSRNEEFIGITIQNILQNIEGDTNIIAVLDGYDTPIPDIPNDPRVEIIKLETSIGQRAATNLGCQHTDAKYIVKTDAHCAFDKGFDVKLMAKMQDNYTMIPIMYNLHAFDWVCPKGHRRYQGPSGVCKECGEPTVKDILWKEKRSPESTAFRFDNTMHFQYMGEYKHRQEYRDALAKDGLTDTMSIQGSFFMITRDKYKELDICDEKHGSWGQQGVEVACKTWLSGGRVVCNHDTWYSHMFRTQGGDFGFPYKLSGNQVARAREYSRELFKEGKWDKAIHPLSWLIEKFSPLPDWGESKGILYYTDNELDEEIMYKCQQQLLPIKKHHRIVSVSLKPVENFGDNIVYPAERGHLMMFKQILAGLKELKTDIVFFTEHDVLYHHSHFDFTPPKKDVFYYNTNVWRLRMSDGHAVRTDDCRQLSGLCAYRELLIDQFEKRVKYVEEHGYCNRVGFEPGTHNRIPELSGTSDRRESKYPNIDLRHGKNVTKSKWSPDQYRNKRFAEGWQETDNLPGWGHFKYLWKKIPRLM